MALVPEGYRVALGAGLLDGVSVITDAELDLHLPRVRALLAYLAFEPLPVCFVDEALWDSSADLLLFAPDDARAGELGSWTTLDLQRDLTGGSSGVGTLCLGGFETSHSHHGLPSPCYYCRVSSVHHATRLLRPPYLVVRFFRRGRSALGRGRFLYPLYLLPVFCGILGTAVEGGEDYHDYQQQEETCRHAPFSPCILQTFVPDPISPYSRECLKGRFCELPHN